MKKGKKYQSLILCGVLVLLLFGTFFANSETTQEEQCWGPLRETYTYVHDEDYYNYENAEPLTETYEEITIWDVESDGNDISFRTDLWIIFLGMVHCESEEDYDEYREAWEFDNVTDSFRVTYRYDSESQLLGFVNPVYPDTMLSGDEEVPINPVLLVNHMFLFYRGLAGLFLPILHTNFSFETDFHIYEQAYSDFEINFKDTFMFQGKKFQGYYYEISYTVEYKIYPGLYARDEIERSFSYNSHGELYNFYNHLSYSNNESGQFELKREGFFNYYIDSYDGSLVVTHSWAIGLSGILIVSVFILYRRRKE